MNTAKLRGKIAEMGKTSNDCAQILSVTPQAFSSKLNGKTKFYINELNTLGDFLEMSEEEKIQIFLR